MPILSWLRSLPAKPRAKCVAYLAQLESSGHELQRPLAAYLREGICELRPSYQGVHYRILCFFSRDANGESKIIVVSHGLVKERRVPDAEIDRALARKQRFEQAPAEHTFHGREG